MNDTDKDKFANEDPAEAEQESSPRSVSDWIKRTLVNGTSAEPLFSLLAQAEKTKKDILQTLTRELRGFLNSTEIQEILLKILSNAKLEVHATIRLIPEKENTNLQKKNIKTAAPIKRPKKIKKKI